MLEMAANVTETIHETQLSSCLNPGKFTAERMGKTLAYCLVLVISLVGNSFISIIVFKTRTMRTTINYFIVNMAVSDLLYTILVILRILTGLYVDSWSVDGPIGQILCKLILFLQHAVVVVSIQSLVLISVDRFGAVVFPLRPSLISSKLCLLLILATWIVAMITCYPYLIVFKLVHYSGILVCQADPVESTSHRYYFLTILVVMNCIPFALMSILYTAIFVKLKSQKIPGSQSTIAEEQRMKRQRNVLKMVVAIVFGFALCWVPSNITFFVVFFVLEKTTVSSCGFAQYLFFALFMSHANCSVNPIICFVFSGNYRQSLKKLLSFFANLRK